MEPKKREEAMKRTQALMLILLVATVVGCTSTRQDADNASLQIPVKLDFYAPDSAKVPVRLRSGQMIDPNMCCPPLELRDGSGAVVQDFSVGGTPERLTARAGTYLLVGHDPSGEECLLRIEVIDE
jgi:hypothetical protein